jgi:hypothetical protein
MFLIKPDDGKKCFFHDQSLCIIYYAGRSEMLAHNILDLGALEQLGSVPRDKNNIPSSAAKRRVFSVCFLDNSAAAVAFNRTAELFARCYANTANTRAVFQYISNQRGICLRSASSIDSAKIAVLLKCCYFRQNNQSVRSRVLKPCCQIMINRKAFFCLLLCAGQEPCGRFCPPFFCESRAPYFYGAF